MIGSAAVVKLGFVGAAQGDIGRLRTVCERLLFDLHVDRVLYLGTDGALDRALHGWAEKMGAPRDDHALLDEVALLAPDAPAEVLDAMLARDARRVRLADVGDVVEASGRHTELFENAVVLALHDRASLDADEQAAVVVTGAPELADLRARQGRLVAAPGHLARGAHHVVVALVEDRIEVTLFQGSGAAVRTLRASARGGAKFEVRP